ncbi:hypothetical protein [Paractinoplanes rishiriensis]|nr:hypothetical protein [Actinoplanes rishiriensis]
MSPIVIVVAVVGVCLIAILGFVLAGASAGTSAASPPPTADAEEACRAAIRSSWERGDQEIKARYAREEPGTVYHTALEDVNIWSSQVTDSAVVVAGDAEWTLRNTVYYNTETTKYTCTATMTDGQITTQVS